MEVDTLPKLGIDLAELKGRISQLPGTLQLIGFVMSVPALAGIAQYLRH